MDRFFSLLFLAMAFFFFSCDPEFEVQDDWQEEVVIFGLLDKTDSQHYVRVQKAFLPEDEDAREVASRKDSTYFKEDEIDVWIEEIINGNARAEYALAPEQMEDKEEGMFANPEHVLYKAPDDFEVKPEATYLIKVETQRGNTVSAETEIVGPPSINFPRRIGGETPEVSYRDSNSQIDVVFSMADRAHFYDMEYSFYYEEFEQGEEDDAELKKASWKGFEGRNPTTDEISYDDKIYRFFSLLAPQIPKEDEKLRRVSHLDINLYGGDRELYTYLRVQEPSISIAETRPEFSNIEGGKGIFASRHKEVVTFNFKESFVDSIVDGTYLPDRNFVR